MTVKQTITAIIYDKRGKVLSIGQNSYVKTHPLQLKHANRVGMKDKIYLHAEIHAITRCPDLERAHKIQVIRFTKDGKPALAKPCSVCMSAIDATPIKIIQHT